MILVVFKMDIFEYIFTFIGMRGRVSQRVGYDLGTKYQQVCSGEKARGQETGEPLCEAKRRGKAKRKVSEQGQE